MSFEQTPSGQRIAWNMKTMQDNALVKRFLFVNPDASSPIGGIEVALTVLGPNRFVQAFSPTEANISCLVFIKEGKAESVQKMRDGAAYRGKDGMRFFQ